VRYVSSLFIPLLFLTATVHAQNLASADEYSQRGIARFEKNDLDGAIADFTKVIEMNGQNLEFCYYFRGMAHYRTGNPAQAILDLSKAIEIKPDPRFLDDRANLLARQGELDRAFVDLTKAIQISPQYAKAYGDRGLVRLMRGEDADAEQDFKKCFELDRALESLFREAASKLKQRALSRYKQEKPADVELIKFSWTEAQAKVLVPSAPAVQVFTTPVSSSGTRVLADPNEKGQPGPPGVIDPAVTTGSTRREPGASTRDTIEYKFTASIRNTGNKTIVAVKWAYFFEPKSLAQEGLAYLFVTRTNIKPGKEKTLNDSLSSTGDSTLKLPHKINQALFKERVAIVRLDYSDGTFWESSN
jgi:tetratricopeptide (TPR) repeat protein